VVGDWATTAEAARLQHPMKTQTRKQFIDSKTSN